MPFGHRVGECTDFSRGTKVWGNQCLTTDLPGPNLPGPNLSGPNLPGPNLQGPNLPHPNFPGARFVGKIHLGPNLPVKFIRGPSCLEPLEIALKWEGWSLKSKSLDKFTNIPCDSLMRRGQIYTCKTKWGRAYLINFRYQVSMELKWIRVLTQYKVPHRQRHK